MLVSIIGAAVYIGKKLQVLDGLHVTTEKIKANIKVIGDHLTATSDEFNHKELQSYSPLKLTKEGEKLINDLGFDTIFEGHQQDFCDYIASEEPKLKYDVELAAIRAVTVLYTQEEYMSFLKVYFYNNPMRNIKNIAPTLGIYIRDKYLEKHPEIAQ